MANLSSLLSSHPEVKTNQDLINYFYRIGGNTFDGAARQATQYGVNLNTLCINRGAAVQGGTVSTASSAGASSGSVAVGSKVKITGTNYATGQTIPNWVKQNTYTVKQVSGSKALIKEITSWVYIKDLSVIGGGTQKPAEPQKPAETPKPAEPQKPAETPKPATPSGKYDTGASDPTAQEQKEYQASVNELDSYSGGKLDTSKFTRLFGPVAREDNRKSAVPASVTLAQAALETGWGSSTIGKAKNLFGIKGTGTAGSITSPTQEWENGKFVTINGTFRAYNSWVESVEDHGKLLQKDRYANAFNYCDNPDQFAAEIHKAGYATDPDYSKKLVNLMKSYNFYQYNIPGLHKPGTKPQENKPQENKPQENKPATTNTNIGVGSKVKITGSNYATGQSIPNWVKNNTYTVKQISGEKALIQEITSWVYVKDLQLVSGGTSTAPQQNNNNNQQQNNNNATGGAKRSNLASDSVDLAKNSNPRTQKVSKITIHHMAGGMGATACANMHARGNGASANYYIGTNGEITAGVSEDRRAWTSSSGTNDQQAITFEVANCKGDPNWEVSDVTYRSMINLCRDICSRYGINAYYDGSTGATLTEHRMFSATLCPGPFLHNRLANGTIQNDIKNGVN